MNGDDLERPLEAQKEPAESSDGEAGLVTEASESKSEWTEREKERAAGLKRGVRSGITSEFGKPAILDSQALSLPQDAPAAVGDVQAQPKAADAGKGSPPASDYKGEGISRHVQPETRSAQAGDTVEKLAKEKLGNDASKEEIQKYIKEIEQVNGLKKGDPLPEGKRLSLPGHTSDGGFVTLDETGRTRHTVWPDGRDKVEDTFTGKWVLKKPSRYGQYEEHGGSKRPEENFVLVKENNGRYRLAESINESPFDRVRPPIELLNADNRPIGSQALMELAEKKIKDPEQLAQFRADMLRYEKTLEGKDLGAIEGAAVYDQIRRLLEHEGDQPTKAADRVVLAQQVMRQIATPSCVDQGNHPTCNVATVESRTYKRNPQAAAQLVADVATTGKYRASDGTEVEIGATSLRPDAQASVNPPPDGARSYASQLFQITAANIAWEQQNARSDPPGKIRYEQYRPGEKDGVGNTVLSYPEDSGERVIDYSKSPPQEVSDPEGQAARSPNLRADQIVDVSNAISGEPRFEHVLFNHEKNLIGDGKGVTVVNSEAQFEQKLIEAVEKGQLPVLVNVDTTCEPFWTDSGGGTAGGSGGTHLVTITGYEAGPPARVSVDGQWGSANDHAGNRSIAVHDLYMSMRNPKASPEVVPELRKEVESRRAINSVDTIKEFELLRLETNQKVKGKEAPAADYDAELGRLMVEVEKKWKNQGTEADPIEQERTRRAFMGMLKRLPADRQDAVLERLGREAPADPELQKQIIQLQARRGRGVIIR